MKSHAVWLLLTAAPCLVGFSPLSWIDPAAGENQSGNEKYQVGQFEEAAGHYSKGNAASPGRPELLYNLGNALERLEKHHEAAAAYQQATQSAGPRLAPDAWYNLGNSLLAAGQAKEAVQAYREALVRNPGHANAKRNLELALAQAKKEPPQKKPGPSGKDQDKDENKDENKENNENDDQKQEQNPSQKPEQSADSDHQPEQGQDQHQPQPHDEPGKAADETQQEPPPPAEAAPKDDQDLSREQAEGLLRSFEQMERRQLQDAHPPKGPGDALGRRDW